ncbi:DUF6119 family protein [Mycobacteroides abscessus]|uniref:DUF6119 family protein n=1 Tax=Mycobacteroides abscessus TaxID=36809 RepID=UPI0006990AAD|nr:DUF6119 family protein [Mycobacteroides abscessus]
MGRLLPMRVRHVGEGPDVKTQRLIVFLLQPIAHPADAIVKGKSATAVTLDDATGVTGTFFYLAKPPSRPAWVPYVKEIVPTIPDLTSSSASGVLIVYAQDRHFALTFGYGRSLLDMSKIERQFGLKVALNRIDPLQLRSMDTKTFEDLVVTRTLQASKSTDLPTFGIDVSKDILRAVTGEPRDTSLSKRLSGADALVLGTTKKASELPKVLGELLDAFSEETYKENFAWIDHLSLITDPVLVDSLDKRLAEQLTAGDTSCTHMAMPEPIGWEDIDSFKITSSRVIFQDLDLDEYLASLEEGRSNFTVDRLKGRKVAVKFIRSGEYDGRWSLYSCLISEQRVAGQLYVLIEGRWLAVSEALAEEVDSFAASLSANRTTLLRSQLGETEPDYNHRIAKARPGEVLCLDGKIVPPGGASSGIELCDLLSAEGEFIHIKRKSRSSTLSHLFAQGSVSATTFVSDPSFRDAVRAKIESLAGLELAAKQKWLFTDEGVEVVGASLPG